MPKPSFLIQINYLAFCISGSQRMVTRPAVSATPGNLLEMKLLSKIQGLADKDTVKWTPSNPCTTQSSTGHSDADSSLRIMLCMLLQDQILTISPLPMNIRTP